MLEIWIRDYPADFAVRGTAGALNALVRAILSKTYLLHYGCDFLPFTEQLPDFKDNDADWALPVENQAFEDDDGVEDDDDDSDRFAESATLNGSREESMHHFNAPSMSSPIRERKPSLPLAATLSAHVDPARSGSEEFSPDSSEFKKYLKDLAKVANEVSGLDPSAVAAEITRIETEKFQDIEVCVPHSMFI